MDRKYIRPAIEQIRWEEYKRGYSDVGELRELKERLYEIEKSDAPFNLSNVEIAILKQTVMHSLNKIGSYDYKMDAETSKKLRDEATSPLYEFMNELREERTRNENRS